MKKILNWLIRRLKLPHLHDFREKMICNICGISIKQWMEESIKK